MRTIITCSVVALLLAACSPISYKSETTKANSRPSESINTEINQINKGIADRQPVITN
jgi:hypothetical protein